MKSSKLGHVMENLLELLAVFGFIDHTHDMFIDFLGELIVTSLQDGFPHISKDLLDYGVYKSLSIMKYSRISSRYQ